MYFENRKYVEMKIEPKAKSRKKGRELEKFDFEELLAIWCQDSESYNFGMCVCSHVRVFLFIVECGVVIIFVKLERHFYLNLISIYVQTLYDS